MSIGLTMPRKTWYVYGDVFTTQQEDFLLGGHGFFGHTEAGGAWFACEVFP